METENSQHLSDVAQVYSTAGGNVVVTDVMAGDAVLLSPEALQALVQYAYDRHGILASPSYALEAERATERKPGQCPCDTEGCSDRSGDGPDPIREGLQRVFA